jgi:hypothetical protein
VADDLGVQLAAKTAHKTKTPHLSRVRRFLSKAVPAEAGQGLL